MRAKVLCDDCGLLTDFDLYLGKEHRPVRVISAYPIANDMCKLKIEGVDTVEKAQPLVGSTLYLDREDAELPEDTESGPTDVYLIKGKRGELMFPAIPEVLINVDIQNEKIEIRPLKGLFDDQEAVTGDDSAKNGLEE